MSEADKTQEDAAVRELASRIYVALVPRAVPEAGSADVPPGAVAAAQLAWKLAQNFFDTIEALKAARVPKSTFKMESMNLSDWTK